jgi:hypothetical protein
MTKLLWALDDADKRFPIGRRVRYYPVSGLPEFVESKIRSQTWAVGSGDIVVAIEGRAGGVSIEHLEVV